MYNLLIRPNTSKEPEMLRDQGTPRQIVIKKKKKKTKEALNLYSIFKLIICIRNFFPSTLVTHIYISFFPQEADSNEED